MQRQRKKERKAKESITVGVTHTTLPLLLLSFLL